MDKVIIHDQGQRGKCTGEAVAYTQAIMDMYERSVYVQYSPEFAWRINKLNGEDTWPGQEGSSVRSGCKTLTKYGVCQEPELPYVYTPAEPTWPSQDIINKAFPNRSVAYARVTTEQEFKHALYTQKRPIMFAIIVFTNYTKMVNGVWPDPTPNDIGNMGHAMVVVGWKKINGRNYWVCLNSWGKGQPTNNGFVYISFDYMAMQMDLYPVLMDAFTFVDLVEVKIPDVLYPEKVTITIRVNGNVIDTKDAPPLLINDRVYVPVRFVSEALGRYVEWDGVSYTVNIS
jgi:hypothetical protein